MATEYLVKQTVADIVSKTFEEAFTRVENNTGLGALIKKTIAARAQDAVVEAGAHLVGVAANQAIEAVNATVNLNRPTLPHVGNTLEMALNFGALLYNYRARARLRNEITRAKQFLRNMTAIMRDEIQEHSFLSTLVNRLNGENLPDAEAQRLALYIDTLSAAICARFAYALEEISDGSKQPNRDTLLFVTHLTLAVLDDFIELRVENAAKLREASQFTAWLNKKLSFDTGHNDLKMTYGEFYLTPSSSSVLPRWLPFTGPIQQTHWSIPGLVMRAPLCTPTGELFVPSDHAMDKSNKYPPQLTTTVSPAGYSSARPIPAYLVPQPQIDSDFNPLNFDQLLLQLENILPALKTKIKQLNAFSDLVRTRLHLPPSLSLQDRLINRQTLRIRRKEFMYTIKNKAEPNWASADQLVSFLRLLMDYQHRFFYDIYIEQIVHSKAMTETAAHSFSKELRWLAIILESLRPNLPTIRSHQSSVIVDCYHTANTTHEKLLILKEASFTSLALQKPHDTSGRLAVQQAMVNNSRITEITLNLSAQLAQALNVLNQRSSSDDRLKAQRDEFGAVVNHANLFCQFLRTQNLPLHPTLQQQHAEQRFNQVSQQLNMLAAQLFWAALRHGAGDLARELLMSYPDSIRWDSYDANNPANQQANRHTALHTAAACGQEEIFALLFTQALATLATENRCLRDIRGPDGGSILHSAAFGGNPSIVKKLLDAGIPADLIDKEEPKHRRRRTPLHVAASSFSPQRAECLRLLLENLALSARKQAVHALDTVNPEYPLSPLLIVCERNPEPISLQYLLETADLLTTVEQGQQCQRTLLSTWQGLVNSVLTSKAPESEKTLQQKKQLQQCAHALDYVNKRLSLKTTSEFITSVEQFLQAYPFDRLAQELLSLLGQQQSRLQTISTQTKLVLPTDRSTIEQIKEKYRATRGALFEAPSTPAKPTVLNNLIEIAKTFIPWCIALHYQQLTQLTEQPLKNEIITQLSNDIRLLKNVQEALQHGLQYEEPPLFFSEAAQFCKLSIDPSENGKKYARYLTELESYLSILYQTMEYIATHFGILYAVVPDGYRTPLTQGEDWKIWQDTMLDFLQERFNDLDQLRTKICGNPIYQTVQANLKQQQEILQQLNKLLTLDFIPPLLRMHSLAITAEKQATELRHQIQVLYATAQADENAPDTTLMEYLVTRYNQNLDGEQWINVTQPPQPPAPAAARLFSPGVP